MNFAVVRIGATGFFVCLIVLGLAGTSSGLGFTGSVVVLVVLGLFAGLYAVPLQVFLQVRPPKEQKGRMIATQNLASWIAILSSALIYFLFNQIVARFDWPQSGTFGLTALLLLPVVLFYRPQNQQLDGTNN